MSADAGERRPRTRVGAFLSAYRLTTAYTVVASAVCTALSVIDGGECHLMP